MCNTRDDHGTTNVLAADKMMRPAALRELPALLFEVLPKIGDPCKPKLVLFFDEAYLLFEKAPKIFVDCVEQAMRLIRSKGAGIYFFTQNPLGVDETVPAQLGNRVQHAMRAYTMREQKAEKTEADTFFPNSDFDCARQLPSSLLARCCFRRSKPSAFLRWCRRMLVRLLASRLGPITPEERRKLIKESLLAGLYYQYC